MMDTNMKWYEDPMYIKMCDCPEIQEPWEPKIGDYHHRTYTVFGEEIDKTIWPDNGEEITILCHKSGVGDWYSGVTIEGEPRTFSGSFEGMIKITSIWLPYQHQLQEMSGLPWIDYDHDCMQQAILVWGSGQENRMSKEQAGIRVVMREKHNRVWNGEAWI